MRFTITVSFATLAVGLVMSQGAHNQAPTHNTFTLVRRTNIVTETNVTSSIPKSTLPTLLSPPVGLRDALENVHRIHNTIDPDAVNNDQGLFRRNVTIVSGPPPKPPTPHSPPKPLSPVTVTPNNPTKPVSGPPPSHQAKPVSAPPPPPNTQTKPSSTTVTTSTQNPPPTISSTSTANPALTTTVTTTTPVNPTSGQPASSQTKPSSKVTLSRRQDKQEVTTGLPTKLPTDATTCATILKKMESAKSASSSTGTKSTSTRRGITGTYNYPLSRRQPQSGDQKSTTNTSGGSSSEDPCARLAAMAQKVKGAISSAL